MTVLIMVLELVFCSKAQAGECHQAQYTGDKGRRWGRANPNLFPCSYNSESERVLNISAQYWTDIWAIT